MFFKKKEVEPEIIPLTETEIKTLKLKLAEKEDSNLSVKDLNLGEILPQSFKQGVINLIDGKHTLFLNENIDSDKFKTFRKSKAGRFNEDVLNFTRNKDHGKYLLLENKERREIVRLIEDEEILLYQTLKLINGIIKDKPYMTLRKLEPSEKLTNSKRYIKEKNDVAPPTSESEFIPPPSPALEDDHEVHATSVSLFNE